MKKLLLLFILFTSLSYSQVIDTAKGYIHTDRNLRPLMSYVMGDSIFRVDTNNPLPVRLMSGAITVDSLSIGSVVVDTGATHWSNQLLNSLKRILTDSLRTWVHIQNDSLQIFWTKTNKMAIDSSTQRILQNVKVTIDSNQMRVIQNLKVTIDSTQFRKTQNQAVTVTSMPAISATVTFPDSLKVFTTKRDTVYIANSISTSVTFPDSLKVFTTKRDSVYVLGALVDSTIRTPIKQLGSDSLLVYWTKTNKIAIDSNSQRQTQNQKVLSTLIDNSTGLDLDIFAEGSNWTAATAHAINILSVDDGTPQKYRFLRSSSISGRVGYLQTDSAVTRNSINIGTIKAQDSSRSTMGVKVMNAITAAVTGAVTVSGSVTVSNFTDTSKTVTLNLIADTNRARIGVRITGNSISNQLYVNDTLLHQTLKDTLHVHAVLTDINDNHVEFQKENDNAPGFGTSDHNIPIMGIDTTVTPNKYRVLRTKYGKLFTISDTVNTSTISVRNLDTLNRAVKSLDANLLYLKDSLKVNNNLLREQLSYGFTADSMVTKEVTASAEKDHWNTASDTCNWTDLTPAKASDSANYSSMIISFISFATDSSNIGYEFCTVDNANSSVAANRRNILRSRNLTGYAQIVMNLVNTPIVISRNSRILIRKIVPANSAYSYFKLDAMVKVRFR